MKISYKNLKRYKEIAQILIKYGFSFIVEKLNIEGVAYKIPLTNPSDTIKNMTTGERIRAAFEELGPTYIKLGQILSTRKDLLDQETIDEISKLRDSVEPFDTGLAKQIFVDELGISIEDVFECFNYEPMAAASIGQVYEAKLKTGEDVIVKIQRPNIEQTIKSDLEIMQTVASTLKDLKRDIEIDLYQIIEEFQTQLIKELDYNFEAINAMKFKKMFKDSHNVYIPDIYSEYTTKKVLVMEKVVGVKLTDTKKIKSLGWKTEKISEIGIESMFKQVFEYGFFHADPHPGNIFIVSSGCIAYIDFGMIGIIDKKTLNILNEIVLASIERNVDRVIYLLMEIDAIGTEADIPGLKQDLLYLIHYYYDVPIERVKVSDILNEIFRFFRKYKVVMPSQLAILAKTIITLEGTGRELNPKFSIGSVGKNFVKHYYINKLKPQNLLLNSKNNIEEVLLDLKTIPKQLRVILRNIEKNNLKINIEEVKVTKLEERINDLATQTSLSLVLASIVVGSSLIIASPNIEQIIWIKLVAMTGFFTSFLIGMLLVIKMIKSKYKKN